MQENDIPTNSWKFWILANWFAVACNLCSVYQNSEQLHIYLLHLLKSVKDEYKDITNSKNLQIPVRLESISLMESALEQVSTTQRNSFVTELQALRSLLLETSVDLVMDDQTLFDEEEN
jgi:hypothetical protein